MCQSCCCGINAPPSSALSGICSDSIYDLQECGRLRIRSLQDTAGSEGRRNGKGQQNCALCLQLSLPRIRAFAQSRKSHTSSPELRGIWNVTVIATCFCLLTFSLLSM